MPSRPIPLWSRQRGAGLIEVMVGLTAGLMLLGAVAYFVLGSKQVNRTHDNVSRMQESGRTALEVMGRAIRQAGARSNVQLPFAAGALPALEGTERGTEGAIGDADSLTVRYDVQDGGEADCLGTAVASGAVTYLFFVDRTSDPPTLKCTNATGAAAQAAAQVVMDNIEDMQITYGVDTNGDGSVESYQWATGLTPAQVTAVRVSLLVRGPTPRVATGSQTLPYNHPGFVIANDGHLRQVYTSTFTVRNHAK